MTMMSSLSINGICEKCKGYKFAPYNSNMSATVKLCHCIKKSDFEMIDLTKKLLDGLQNVRKKLR
jgi:hypothetical protein